jgi:hypothetical protein
MLKKTLEGLYVDRLGFVAAIMLQWNQKVNGVEHYTFLVSPFNSIPHDIVSNGEDDSVLLSKDMYQVLLARKVARPITDEEAEKANKNADAMDANQINAAKEAAFTAANVEAEKAKTAIDPTAKAKPVPTTLQLADKPSLTQAQLALIAAATGVPAVSKKG